MRWLLVYECIKNGKQNHLTKKAGEKIHIFITISECFNLLQRFCRMKVVPSEMYIYAFLLTFFSLLIK